MAWFFRWTDVLTCCIVQGKASSSFQRVMTRQIRPVLGAPGCHILLHSPMFESSEVCAQSDSGSSSPEVPLGCLSPCESQAQHCCSNDCRRCDFLLHPDDDELLFPEAALSRSGRMAGWCWCWVVVVVVVCISHWYSCHGSASPRVS